MEERDPIPFDKRAQILAEAVMQERRLKNERTAPFEPEQTREELIAGAYLRVLRATNQ